MQRPLIISGDVDNWDSKSSAKYTIRHYPPWSTVRTCLHERAFFWGACWHLHQHHQHHWSLGTWDIRWSSKCQWKLVYPGSRSQGDSSVMGLTEGIMEEPTSFFPSLQVFPLNRFWPGKGVETGIDKFLTRNAGAAKIFYDLICSKWLSMNQCYQGWTPFQTPQEDNCS